MINRLILITASFPYGNGETFLEDELPYLANAFDEIIILHQSGGNNKREIPANVQVKKTQNLPRSIAPLRKAMLREIALIATRARFRDQILSLKALYYYVKSCAPVYNSIVQEIQDDVNCIVYSYWSDSGAIAAALVSLRNVPTVARCHGWDVYQKIHHPPYLPFRALLKRNLSCIFPISNKGADVVKSEWWGKAEAKIKTAKLGVTAEKSEIHSRQKPFTIATCSAIIPLKRLDLLAKTLVSINDMDISWHHIGDGVDRPIIEKLSEELGFNINITLHGQLPRKEVLELYKSIAPTVFINLSTSEGIPVSIMEAMSLGIPAIATDVGGTSEIVNTQNGILLESNPSIQSIAQAIRIFKELDDNRYRKLQSNAKNTWASLYSADRNYSIFAATLLQLTNHLR